jgi:dienelactone hydrolase
MINLPLKILLLSLIISSCVTKINGTEIADQLALNNHFTKKEIKGGDFFITTYQKITDAKLPYVIYIEGDGRIVSGDMISKDPTPTKPMLINLAFDDPRPNIVYMGRPCQYTPMAKNPKCNKEYWTNKRLSEEVIASINEVINKITSNTKFDLVGFSGGGGAAVLIGARNHNVRTIITIAGNLDILDFDKHHNLRPMNGSLNPIDYTTKVEQIPQLHLSGGKDRIIPTFITQNFVNKISSKCAQLKIIPEAEHSKNWDKHWPKILKINNDCHNN